MFDLREPEDFDFAECPTCYFYCSPVVEPDDDLDFEFKFILEDRDFEYELSCPRCHDAGVVKTDTYSRQFYIETKIQKCPEWAFGVDNEDEDWVKIGTLPPDRPDRTPTVPLKRKKPKPVVDLGELKKRGLVYKQPKVSGLIYKQPVPKPKPKKSTEMELTPVDPPPREKPPPVKLTKKEQPWGGYNPEPREPGPLGEFFVESPVTYLAIGPRGGLVIKKGLPYLRRGGFKDCSLCGHRGNHCEIVNWNDGGWDVMCPNCGCSGIIREFETKEKALKFWDEKEVKNE